MGIILGLLCVIVAITGTEIANALRRIETELRTMKKYREE